jgi:hypothetical protein
MELNGPGRTRRFGNALRKLEVLGNALRIPIRRAVKHRDDVPLSRNNEKDIVRGVRFKSACIASAHCGYDWLADALNEFEHVCMSGVCAEVTLSVFRHDLARCSLRSGAHGIGDLWRNLCPRLAANGLKCEAGRYD